MSRWLDRDKARVEEPLERRSLSASHEGRINAVLFHIHGHLHEVLQAQSLATQAAYSPHHFHRVFKAVTGENVNDYIRRARLEYSANRLMFEKQSTVVDVAISCGFQSPASFTQAFKKHFGCAPTAWRQGGYQTYSRQRLNSQIPVGECASLPDVAIVPAPAYRLAYVRHLGYDRSIRFAWQYLRAWAYARQIEWSATQMLGLHHSNPDLVPLAQCRYVAGITVDATVTADGRVGILTVPAGIHARMTVTGGHGDLLPVLQRFYHDWLPASGYHLANTPGYAVYRQNHFLNDEGRFDLDFYIPLAL